MTLLTPDEYRLLRSTELEDEALLLLLDAAEADIIAYAGPGGSTVEWFDGGQRILALAHQAEDITLIVENDILDTESQTLAIDDYLIDPRGYLLYRVGTGTNQRWTWWGRVVVTYIAVDQEAQRKIAQSDLVNLAENYASGVTSETVGSWTQLYQQATGANAREHDDILGRLISHGRMRVI